VDFTTEWAKKWQLIKGWSKRKETTSKGQTPIDFADVKIRFLESIQLLVWKHNVPAKLLVYWDQTACKYIQCGDWTRNES